jgi:hypothetical protein
MNSIFVTLYFASMLIVVFIIFYTDYWQRKKMLNTIKSFFPEAQRFRFQERKHALSCFDEYFREFYVSKSMILIGVCSSKNSLLSTYGESAPVAVLTTNNNGYNLIMALSRNNPTLYKDIVKEKALGLEFFSDDHEYKNYFKNIRSNNDILTLKILQYLESIELKRGFDLIIRHGFLEFGEYGLLIDDLEIMIGIRDLINIE